MDNPRWDKNKGKRHDNTAYFKYFEMYRRWKNPIYYKYGMGNG